MAGVMLPIGAVPPSSPAPPRQEVQRGNVLDQIIEREQGYVNHPADRGGPTKYGVTLSTLRKARGKRVTAADVAKLTKDEAKAVLWNGFVQPFAFIDDPRLLDLVADASVHHGPQRAARWLQQAVGTKPDGRVGPQTVASYAKTDPAEVFAAVLAERERHVERLAKVDPSQKVFLEGWRKRMKEFK